MHANYLDTLDWGILIAYFLILIGIGIWASLKRKKGSSLFLAERSLKWHHIGFSMWGTTVSYTHLDVYKRQQTTHTGATRKSGTGKPGMDRQTRSCNTDKMRQ